VNTEIFPAERLLLAIGTVFLRVVSPAFLNTDFAMSQLIEFIGNHTLLFIAFSMTLGMLVYTEYMRTVFLDVRDDSEYKGGHLLNSRSIPVSKFAERMHEIEKFKDQDVVVYCDNGMRSSRAIAKLKKAGFSQLFSLAGGLTAWEKANLPTVSK